MQSLTTKQFQQIIYEYYDQHGRHDLLWRKSEPDGSFSPYKILVSELMLQQTQVQRVTSKYQQFLEAFPELAALSAAPLGDVLRVWSGLGYNRRAKYLHQTAISIVADWQGVFPQRIDQLVQLPGIGSNTAGAVLAYAFNQPVVFIETNIRTTLIHHFFDDQTDISDKAILQVVERTLDHNQPRLWYWALMDYGSYLKRTIGNLNTRSQSYAKQSKFSGSRRQIRGAVIQLLNSGPMNLEAIGQQIPDERLMSVITDLFSEGMLQKQDDVYML